MRTTDGTWQGIVWMPRPPHKISNHVNEASSFAEHFAFVADTFFMMKPTPYFGRKKIFLKRCFGVLVRARAHASPSPQFQCWFVISWAQTSYSCISLSPLGANVEARGGDTEEAGHLCKKIALEIPSAYGAHGWVLPRLGNTIHL